MSDVPQPPPGAGRRLTADDALRALAADPLGVHFHRMFHHGSLEIEIYKPRYRDLQTVHTRDEVYLVIAGHGQFLCAGTRQPFGAGDLLFAPAGIEHRFEDFSDDFSTWVLFYGPENGEHDP
jgi:mannose-6-phosphate isomerase-like protein (cupin superfamily)